MEPPLGALYGEVRGSRAVTEATAIERCYREQGEKLWRAVLLFGGDPEVASDAVAEAFAQAIRRGEGIRELDRWVWADGVQDPIGCGVQIMGRTAGRTRWPDRLRATSTRRTGSRFRRCPGPHVLTAALQDRLSCLGHLRIYEAGMRRRVVPPAEEDLPHVGPIGEHCDQRRVAPGSAALSPVTASRSTAAREGSSSTDTRS